MDIMCLTDSTGDTTIEWTHKFAEVLARAASKAGVVWQSYNDATQVFEPNIIKSTPDQIVSHNVWSGAVGSASTQYHIDNAATILQAPDDVDTIFIALGHNAPRDQATYQNLIDLCVASWPRAVIYLTYQNPWLSSDPWGGPGAGLMYDTVTALAKANSLVTFDVWSAFNALGDFSSLMADNVHPNEAGSELWAETAFNAWAKPAVVKRIPNGTTWIDTVGNTWTANGDDLWLFDTVPNGLQLTVTQVGKDVWVQWSGTEQEVLIDRVVPDPDDRLAVVAPTVTTFVDVWPDTVAEALTVSYEVEFLATGQTLLGSVVLRPVDVGFTYGEVDVLETSIRYADIVKVKKRVGIEDASFDDEVTQAIIAGETAMDLWWGRSFPDTGSNPRWSGIPIQVSQAAENVAVAVLKQTDAPFGIAGSDAFALGELDIDDTVRRELSRSPLLKSFKVKAGMGLAR